MEDETKELLEALEENVETALNDDTSELEVGVALEQAAHHANEAFESYQENH